MAECAKKRSSVRETDRDMLIGAAPINSAAQPFGGPLPNGRILGSATGLMVVRFTIFLGFRNGWFIL
jgi:hypothetical protein